MQRIALLGAARFMAFPRAVSAGGTDRWTDCQRANPKTESWRLWTYHSNVRHQLNQSDDGEVSQLGQGAEERQWPSYLDHPAAAGLRCARRRRD